MVHFGCHQWSIISTLWMRAMQSRQAHKLQAVHRTLAGPPHFSQTEDFSDAIWNWLCFIQISDHQGIFGCMVATGVQKIRFPFVLPCYTFLF